MNNWRFAVAIGLLMASLNATGSELGYRHLEGGYAQLNLDTNAGGFDSDIRGFYIGGSTELVNSLHLFGTYISGHDTVDVSVPGIGMFDARLNINQYKIGVGFHHALSERADLVTDASYLATEADLEGIVDADSGHNRFSVGVRGLLSERIDGWLTAHYTIGDIYDGALSAGFGGQLSLSEDWGLTVDAELGNAISQITIGARVRF